MKNRILIAALALAAASAPLAGSAQPYNSYHWNHGTRSASDRISSVNGSSFTLRDGQTVFLHQGTIINPTGLTLQPGMMVAVNGSPAGNGNINADEVDLAGGYDRNGYYH